MNRAILARVSTLCLAATAVGAAIAAILSFPAAAAMAAPWLSNNIALDLSAASPIPWL